MATWEYEKVACYVKQKKTKDHLPIYRAFDGSDHFYTIDENEYSELPASFQRQGKSFYIAEKKLPGYSPFYELYHPEAVDHFFTANRPERADRIKKGWEDKGILGYVRRTKSPQHAPLYQAFHSDLTDHFYTPDPAELEAKGSPIPETPATHAIATGFDSEADGYLFRNRFLLSANLLGLALDAWELGFCGGMSLSSIRVFNTTRDLTRRKTIPRQGEGLYDKLLKLQLETVPPHIIRRLYLWQSSPDTNTTGFTKSIGQRTKEEWPKIRKELDSGWPVVLVLIRVHGFFGNPTRNHQVVAIGYKTYQTQPNEVISIQIYDPNHPRETGELVFTLGLNRGRINAHQRPRRPGQPLRGFFLNHKG